MRAIWNDVVIAESNDTIVIENNHYFPPDSINKKYFQYTAKYSPLPLLSVLRHPGRGAAHQLHRLPDILGLQAGVVVARRGILSAGKVGILLQMDLLVDFNFIFDVS